MFKPLLACLAAPFIASATIPESVTFTYHPSVVQVTCDKGLGSAFRIEGGAFISVNHVMSMHDCRVGGWPVFVTYPDVVHDVSFGRMGGVGYGLKVNCGGYRDGETYWAVGYAFGRPIQRMVAVIASDEATAESRWGSFETMLGAEQFIPGMSGGAVLNRAGEAVGTVNGYNTGDRNLSYSQPLSATPICTGHI